MNGREYKDYYKILGVEKAADDKAVKAAFRRLARKYHPDANPGDKSAEERFKEVNEAYEVLSDKEKRAAYDRGPQAFFGMGGQGFGGPGGVRFDFGGHDTGTFGSFSDIFDLFGGGAAAGAGTRRQAARKGRDLSYELTLSFEDAFKGVTTKINVRRQAACPTCRGTGAAPGTRPKTCPGCGGRGVVGEDQGFFSLSRPCPQCAGSGQVIEKPCATCQGQGAVIDTKPVTVRIPPGVGDGSKIRLPGKGEAGLRGGPAGDLYVVTRVSPHAYFRRRGSDVLVDVPVTITEASLGADVAVPVPGGGRVTIKVPPGTQDGKTLRVKGKGAPRLKGGGAGDLLATVRISVPQRLTAEQKELLNRFASARGDEDVRAHLTER